jgi:hypothetical protein
VITKDPQKRFREEFEKKNVQGVSKVWFFPPSVLLINNIPFLFVLDYWIIKIKNELSRVRSETKAVR